MNDSPHLPISHVHSKKMEYQNTIMFTIDMNVDVTNYRQRNEVMLLNTFENVLTQRNIQMEAYFRATCTSIAVGYALHRNVLNATGRLTYKTAVRRYREFRDLPALTKKRHFKDQEYIKHIFENWDSIVRNCTLPRMIHLDVKGFKLWKLAKCSKLSYVDEENNRCDPNYQTVRPRPIQKEYQLHQIQDLIDNIPGATDRILDAVQNDPEQIKEIAKDFHNYLLRRANPLPAQ